MPLIAPGKKAPEFTLPDQSGVHHSLSAYRGRNVVLYFYPKDDTPGCTAEACSFRDNLPKFEEMDAVVLGVSILDSRSKAKFAGKHRLNFPLLADERSAVAKAYGAWVQKSMYGKSYMGVARISYLIDAGGVVARRWDEVKPDVHANEVLAAVKALQLGETRPASEAEAKPAKRTAGKPALKSGAKAKDKGKATLKKTAKKTARKSAGKTVKKAAARRGAR
ncbi:MAG: thioredoxin-dependent thiol peroxidase [Phycisphaerales bacterium]|nr:thioredoxin-dependent thiol peroxidase [Phycisphaerales bacterium]